MIRTIAKCVYFYCFITMLCYSIQINLDDQDLSCDYLYSGYKNIQFSQCKSESPFPINVSLTVTTLKQIYWRGFYNWDYYLSDYSQIFKYCISGGPAPQKMQKGTVFRLQLLCEKLPRPLKKYDSIMFSTFWYDDQHGYIGIDYAIIPIPGFQRFTKNQKITSNKG